MSSDHQILAAIAVKTGQEMRYFELVQATCGTDKWRRCFMCLGKHAVYFLTDDLNGKIHRDAELFYSHVTNIIVDTTSTKTLMFVLEDNKGPGWKSDRLFIQCDNRDQMLKHFRCNWQTDHMWRTQRVLIFPLYERALTRDKTEPKIEPFMNFKWKTYNHYSHMIPNDFDTQPNSIQAENTGEYFQRTTGVSLVVHVHETLTLDQLVQLKRDHIRWVAAEYKVQLVQEVKNFYVLRNQQREKRMNLGADIAAWYGWEIIIRTKQETVICLPLRRQFIPPVCNCAQDIAVILRVPVFQDGSGRDLPFDKSYLLDAYLIADSLMPEAESVVPYRDIVQAKLDALRFDAESFEWVKTHLKLNTKWQNYAKAFLAAIIDFYIKDIAGHFNNRLKEDLDRVGQDDPDAEDMPIPKKKGIEIIKEIEELIEDDLPRGGEREPWVKHQWKARVAQYFTWAVDGGLLQGKFTLDIMLDYMMSLTEEASKKIDLALQFMLHMRPLDNNKPFAEGPIVQAIRERPLKSFNFNDRVMQAILSQDYLRKRLGRQNESDFFLCLAHLLDSNAGVSLKASVCRIFMEMGADQPASSKKEEGDSNLMVVPSLIEILRTEGVFLATYASAALVNLSDGNEAVKMKLMSNNIASLAAKAIKTKDDELICYTLMLLVNLTKQPHHRSVIARGGLLPMLYDLLTSSYHQCGKVAVGSIVGGAVKERLLTQVAIIIGHFSIDFQYRKQFLNEAKGGYGYTVRCLLYMFDTCTEGSSLMAKVLFALKQLCKDSGLQKQKIGNHIIKRLTSMLDPRIPSSESPSMLGNKEITAEFLFQAMLQIQMLATHSTNCELMDKHKLYDVLLEIGKLPVSNKISDFDGRVAQLKAEIDVVVSKDYTTAD